MTKTNGIIDLYISIKVISLGAIALIKNRLYPNGQYKDHEKDLLSYYESITGFHPVLSSNK